MKIAVLGTGVVGTTVGSKLIALGHEVTMGSRSANNDKALAWAKQAGGKAKVGTFADAAASAELLFNCTMGAGSLEALKLAGENNLAGKVLIDISNPLDFSKGMPPTLFVSNTDSLGEQIQKAFPKTKVVKALNTINCELMVNPGKLKGEHTALICGDDAAAKGRVNEVLRGWFGWQDVVDVGDMTAARGLESYLLLWVRLWGSFKTADFNFKLVR